MRYPATISTSARCRTISAIDHFPGDGLRRIFAADTPFSRLSSFFGAAVISASGSWPSRWLFMRLRYCSAVSGITFSYKLNQTLFCDRQIPHAFTGRREDRIPERGNHGWNTGFAGAGRQFTAVDEVDVHLIRRVVHPRN